MQHFGFTRTSVKASHSLLTPDSFIRAPFVHDTNGTRVVHINPACGAGFTMYTLEAQPQALFAPMLRGCSSLMYVLEGEFIVQIGKKKHRLVAQHYAFLPPESEYTLQSPKGGKAMVFEKPYIWGDTARPEAIFGNTQTLPKTPVLGDPRVLVQLLLPDHPSFDFAVNIMNFEPGAHLGLVETHVMEHGLLMLAGGGIYRLDTDWYPVQAGDVIYMAPYCPQWFGALGSTPSSYLIYKDWNRHALE
ncbi:MAG: (S)-ureidoglycine aminohydrolase [Deinococcales bacterium]